MTKRIWAVGASVRALAESLVSSGYEVIASDLFGDADLARIAEVRRITDYPQELREIPKTIQADAWIYTGGLENEPDLVEELCQHLPLLGNRGECLRRVRDV